MQTVPHSSPIFEKRIIGDCTLYRGDCLELLRAGPGKTGLFGKIGAIVSDPPYGIGYQHGGGGERINQISNLPARTDAITGDDLPFSPTPWINAAPCNEARKGTTYGGEPLIVYGGEPLIVLWGADHYMQRLPIGGTMLAWDKHLGRGPDDSFADCEWAWCGRKVKREVFRWLWKGVCTQKSALNVATTPITERTSGKVFARVHVSQKPVELMRWCIDKVRPLAGLPVLDPYMGSGSTAIAALSLGHTFIGCEIDPGHFDVACRRIEAFYQRQGIALPGRESAP